MLVVGEAEVVGSRFGQEVDGFLSVGVAPDSSLCAGTGIELGFKGGTRSKTEWNQWVASEKEHLAAVMERYGIEWEQKGTHEKHLSVLDFQKQERAKEVANLEERKAELLEENSAFETINGALCNQLTQVNEELHSSEEELSQSRQEADKAKKRADKYQKRIDELAPKVKNMERLAAEFSANPEELLPEAIIVETGKAYREKKAKPLVEKIVKVLRSVYSAFLDLSNRFERLQESYSRERSRNEHLKGRLQEMIDENRELRETAEDMECVKAVFGSQKVDEVISQAKRQEKIERERKQTMKKKHDREAI